MGRLYLIRHALPDIPPGKRQCIGSADVPLGTLGKLQAVLLGEYMKDKPIQALYSSDLSRAVQTARALGQEPVLCPGLREMDAGDWDGLYFDEIEERWPEIYARRGVDPGYPIPGSEPPEQGQCRFRNAILQILARQEGDIAVVAHCTVIQSFLSFLLGTDVSRCREYRLDYTGICTIDCDGSGFSLLKINEIPSVPLTDRLCEHLLTAAGAPLAHCQAVAAEACRLADALRAAGYPLDRQLILYGALLHDLARKEREHAVTGARWLEALGYPETARIVRAHHDPGTEDLCEETIVFLADKLPLEPRFARSLEKCTTEEARAAHQRRYRQALALKKRINTLCRKELIP